MQENPVPEGVRWRVVILCALVCFLDGYDMIIAPVSIPALSAAWQLEAAQFSIALAAGVFGMGIGAAFITPLGDRWGRRPLVLGGFLAVTLSCLLIPLTTSVPQLAAVRFITGLGLGVSLANALTLTSEYAIPHLRSRIIACVYAMSALGGAFGGLIAAPILNAWGWQGVYIAGGLFPLLLVPALWYGLAESPQFLALRDGGTLQAEEQEAAAAAGDSGAFGRWRVLLSPTYRASTLLVASLFFLCTFCTYVISSWLPTLLHLAGWSMEHAVRAVTVFSFGGLIGGFLLGWLVDKGMVTTSLLLGFGLTAASLTLINIIPEQITIWMLLVTLMGVGTIGVAYALTAFAAIVYPTALRASGIGAAGACGRLGATLAPLAGGALLALGMQALQILLSLLIPMAIALILILLFSRRVTAASA